MNPNYKSIYRHCEAKHGSYPNYPFGESVLVFKVMGKMFILIFEGENPLRMNLKCDPDDAQALRAQHSAIIPGYHMNKKHWITIILDGSLEGKLVTELIDHSYDLVIAGLRKVDREALAGN